MNRLSGLLAAPETGMTSSPIQGLGRPPELREAPQWPFSTSTGASARPFFSERLSEGILLKPAQPLRHL
jgi:hypothetical protein